MALSTGWLFATTIPFFYNFKKTIIEQFPILSLHLGTETYDQYTMPRGFDEVPLEAPTIGVLGGCLCFSYSHRETGLVMWQMKEFGVENSWTQFLKVNYHDLLIDYGNFSDNERRYFQLVPLFLSGDGDSLLLRRNIISF